MKIFDYLFRVALLVVLAASLLVATWHLSWLHNQALESRYEMQVMADHPAVFVIYRQQRVIYSGIVAFNDSKPIDWHTSSLPK